MSRGREGTISWGLHAQEGGRDVPNSKRLRKKACRGHRGPAAIHTRKAVFFSPRGVVAGHI